MRHRLHILRMRVHILVVLACLNMGCSKPEKGPDNMDEQTDQIQALMNKMTLEDKLHLNREGYALWSRIIKEKLKTALP